MISESQRHLSPPTSMRSVLSIRPRHLGQTYISMSYSQINYFGLNVLGRFKIAYELLTLRALEISMFHAKKSFNVCVRYLYGISKVLFEIPHKISYPFIEWCAFYSQVKIWELLDLRAHTSFWNAPLALLYQKANIPVTWPQLPQTESLASSVPIAQPISLIAPDTDLMCSLGKTTVNRNTASAIRDNHCDRFSLYSTLYGSVPQRVETYIDCSRYFHPTSCIIGAEDLLLFAFIC